MGAGKLRKAGGVKGNGGVQCNDRSAAPPLNVTAAATKTGVET